jgi:hypothetical protein
MITSVNQLSNELTTDFIATNIFVTLLFILNVIYLFTRTRKK